MLGVVVVLPTLPLVLAMDRPLRVLELGDEQAVTFSGQSGSSRSAVPLIVLGLLLVGFATRGAGPIPFVALMAGPIAARLLRPADSSVLVAGFVGASLVLAADLVANQVLPVGAADRGRHRPGRRPVPGLAAGDGELVGAGGMTGGLNRHQLRADRLSLGYAKDQVVVAECDLRAPTGRSPRSSEPTPAGSRPCSVDSPGC